ncbi:asparagine synthase (glutamine-hydrolyzing), partial [Candidatus Microgenomates bacterium]|nr:asparagine synthase (glutamine-hydrolyzing) [Candidatus Microgenomates bacterium]
MVHGYDEWGDQCFDRFNGMFGIALYDLKKKRLIIARDHFGIKPLYYALTKANKFMFSSEIKPLIGSGLIDKKPNDKIIYRYLKYRIHDDTPETFFSGIFRVMPGEMLIVEGREITKKYYSQLEDVLKKSTSEGSLSNEQIEQFGDRLKEAIKLRLISEVPVGTCLSGGLDSSTIAATVNELLTENVSEAQSVGKSQNTFSAVFPGSKNDEEKYIDDLLKVNKTITSHKIYPKPEEFFDEIEDFVRTQEEPTISTGPYAQYKVMQTAHKHVTVLLDGQGADEMLGGYLPYYFVYLRQLRASGQRAKLLREVVASRDILYKYLKLKMSMRAHPAINPSALMNPKFRKTYKHEIFEVEQNNLKLRLIQDIFYNSLQSLLRYEDKNAMRFSLEGRVPFLDTNLVKFIFSLPDEAIIKNGWNKHVLRRAADKMLPASIAKRRNKIGFTTPEEEWFMRMKNRIYSIFLSEQFAGRAYFNQTEVVAAFRKYVEGKTTDSMLFWRMLNLEIWFRVFFDQDAEKVKKVAATSTMNVGETVSKPYTANGKTYDRLLVKTDVFAKDDDFGTKIASYITYKQLKENKKWFVVVSEKVVAIAQGRSYFIWDIKPGVLARVLSKHVTRTPFGIGLGSPWTM